MTMNASRTPSLTEIKDEIADAGLEKVSGGDKTTTTSSSVPSISEIVVTKRIDKVSTVLFQ